MWQTLGYSPKDCQLGEMPVSACQSASGKPLIFWKYLFICEKNTNTFYPMDHSQVWLVFNLSQI
jgi:hypothetical protein